MAEKRQILLDVQANIAKSQDRIVQLTKALENNKKALRDLEAENRKSGKTNEEVTKKLVARRRVREGLTKKIREAKKDLELSNRVTKAAAGSNNELRARLSTLTKQYNALGKQQRDSTKAGRELQKNIRGISDELKKNESAIGDNRRNVGNYKDALSSLGGRIGSALTSPLAAAAAALAALGAGFKKAIETVIEFGSQTAKLQAISGATNEQMKTLTNTAKELGSATEFTATQVAELQTNYAKLGFTTEQIENATAATLDLATATGEDLAQAATVVGSTVRAFGLEASDTQRVTDVMAASFSGSALDLEKFSTAMRQVAPVAAASNFSLEETTALLGTLANSGFDASQAGTSLRSILLKMADPAGKLAKELGRTVTSGEDLGEALLELKGRGIDLADALEITDVRSVAAFKRFIEGVEDTNKLTDSLNNAEGAAARMAATVRDTLQGDVDSANSAMEGLALTVGEGLEPVIRSSVKAFTLLIRGVNDLLNINKDVTEGVKNQQAEFNTLVRTLIRAKDAGDESVLTFKQQEEIINQLNREYREYIPEVISLTDETDKLRKTQDRANESFARQISLLANQEILADFTRQLTKASRDIKEAEIALDRLRETGRSGDFLADLQGGGGVGGGGATKEQRITSLQNVINNLREDEITLQEEFERAKEVINQGQIDLAFLLASDPNANVILDDGGGGGGGTPPTPPAAPTGPDKESPRVKQVKKDLDAIFTAEHDHLSRLNRLVKDAGDFRVQNAEEVEAKLALIQLQERTREEGFAALRESLFVAGQTLLREESIAGRIFASGRAAYNTFLAVTEALKNPPGPPSTIPAAVAAGVFGAAQIAAINRIQFAEGGLVEGPGTGTSDSIPARLSDGEAVINAKSTAAFLPVLDYINRSHGGAALVPGNKFRFADGGLATAQSRQSAEQVQSLTRLERALTNMPTPVVSVKEINKVQNRVEVKQNVGRI